MAQLQFITPLVNDEWRLLRQKENHRTILTVEDSTTLKPRHFVRKIRNFAEDKLNKEQSGTCCCAPNAHECLCSA